MSVKRKGEKSLLSKQEIATRRKALSQKKMQHGNSGRRAIAGVFVLAVSVLSLLSVATFNAKDRVGPGFKNAVGPVGHAIAEALRGLLGVCAFVLPMVGLYVAGLLFVGNHEKRRWPQVAALTLLLISGAVLAQLMFTEDASWAHAPGGLIGRELGGFLTALFSTVGTVVLVGAIAAVAFIVGTQFAFLKLCSWVWAKTLVGVEKFKLWFAAFLEKQKENAAARKLAAEKAAEEEAAFLAELEEEEAELAAMEAEANEADEAADEADRLLAEKENVRLAELAEKERLKAEREKAIVEREAARLAREALKTARANEKENRKNAAAAIAPSLLADTLPPAPAAQVPQPTNGDPAWAAAFQMSPAVQSPKDTVLPAEFVHSAPPPPRRLPNIVEAPVGPPPPPAEAFMSSPKMAPMEAIPSGPSLMDAAAAIAPQTSAIVPAVGAAAGATALARMPLIVEPKAPPRPTKKEPKEDFLFTDGREAFEVPPMDLLEVHRKERA
ncbi:MAG: DNA translocase FtsK 4TM domain-containing protein, partial [Archangium sp.]